VIPFLVVIVVIVVIGVGALAYRNRPEGSIESGIRSFRREMRALAPPGDQRRMSRDGDDRAPDQPEPPSSRGGQ
jgi:hypothetical protein